MRLAADKGTARILELLEISIDKESYEKIDDWLNACRLVARAAETAIDKQVRVDENVLRQEQFDRLPEIIALIQAEEKRLYS